MSSEHARLVQQVRSIERTALPDDNSRVQLLTAAQALCQKLETPFEWVQRMTWQEPLLNLCLTIADDLQLFRQLGQRTDPPKTVAELAGSCGAESALVGRILKHLAGKGVVGESFKDENFYCATELSETLALPEGSSGIRHVARLYTPLFQHIPAYLKSTNYTVPRDNRNGPFQQALARPGQSYFEWIHESENKDAGTNFNLLMKFTTQFRKSWIDVFAPSNLLKEARAIDAPVLVDIGGGTGTDVTEFRRRYPDVPGRVILQELPAVIISAQEKNGDLGIECQEYDFFKPEPVHGARIYFMGSVLHDWPDQDARNILRSIVPAMTRGYSKLLLSENIIPATGCHPHLTAIDLSMMILFGSQERTEKHWRELLTSEGLNLVAVHTIPSCLKSVLEVELI